MISDTHGQHRSLKLPDADILIHAGDMSGVGKKKEIDDFFDWFSNLPHKYKITICGNHDFWFDADHYRNFDLTTEMAANGERLAVIPDNIIYLEDSGIEIEGIKIWGSPVTPEFHNWAFNRQRGPVIKKHWDLIPDDTDIVISHGPPAGCGYLERTIYGEPVGCVDLADALTRVKPKLSVFGHIHEGYGLYTLEAMKDDEGEEDVIDHKLTFINASVLNRNYNLVNDPVIIDWDELNE